MSDQLSRTNDTPLHMEPPKTEDQAAEALTGKALTLEYRPARANALAISESDSGRFGAFSWRVLHDIESMICHPDVAQPYSYYKAGISSVKFEVTAQTMEQAKFAHELLTRIWERHLDQLQYAYDYGWCGYELTYTDDDHGRMDLDQILDLHPLDVWAVTRKGRYRGLRLKPSGLSSLPSGGILRLQGSTDLWGPGKWPAKALWLTHERRFDRFYGRTQLLGAWRPWMRLAGRDGAEDVLDGCLYRVGYQGPEIRYPPEDFKKAGGGVDYDAARNEARQMAEQAKSGFSVALPSTYHQGGQPKWEVKFPTSAMSGIGTFLDWESNLQKQISRGVGVPPELLEASDTGSGYSGRKIPLLGFYESQLKNARNIVRALVDQVVLPLLKWNWGDDAWAEVKVDLEPPAAITGDKEQAQGGMPPEMSAQGAEQANDSSTEPPPSPDDQPAPDAERSGAGLADLLGGELSTALQPPGPLRPPVFTLSAAQSPNDPEDVLDAVAGRARTLTRQARAALLAAVEAAPYGQALTAARRWADEWSGELAELLGETRLAAILHGMDGIASQLDAGTLPLTGQPELAEDSALPLVKEAANRLAGMQLLGMPGYLSAKEAAQNAATVEAEQMTAEAIGKVRSALARSIEEGGTLAEFKADLKEAFSEGVLTPDHVTEQVFRTNVMAAYSDGQERLLADPLVGDLFPYRAYYATHDDRTREEHLGMEKHGIDGTNIYRADDPVWQMFRPPWGHQCRCTFTPVSVAEAARRGIPEAQQWLSTGVEPATKAHVPMPPWKPDDEFLNRGVELSTDPDYPVADLDSWSEPTGYELAAPDASRYQQRKVTRGPRKGQTAWYDSQRNRIMPANWKPSGEKTARPTPKAGKTATTAKTPKAPAASVDELHEAITTAAKSGKPVNADDVKALADRVKAMKGADIQALRTKLGLSRTGGGSTKEAKALDLAKKMLAGDSTKVTKGPKTPPAGKQSTPDAPKLSLPRKPRDFIDAVNLIGYERHHVGTGSSGAPFVPIGEIADALGVPRGQAEEMALDLWRKKQARITADSKSGNEVGYIELTGSLNRQPEPMASSEEIIRMGASAMDAAKSLVTSHNGGLIPIAKIRELVKSPDKASFDEAMLRLQRQGKLSLTAISDASKASREELAGSIPGNGNTLFYVELPEPATAAPGKLSTPDAPKPQPPKKPPAKKPAADKSTPAPKQPKEKPIAKPSAMPDAKAIQQRTADKVQEVLAWEASPERKAFEKKHGYHKTRMRAVEMFKDIESQTRQELDGFYATASKKDLAAFAVSLGVHPKRTGSMNTEKLKREIEIQTIGIIASHMRQRV